MSNSISTHSIVEAYSNIENIHSIERDRERTLGDSEFQLWCKQYKIGSRVEVKDFRATELMQQYTNYPKWVASMY